MTLRYKITAKNKNSFMYRYIKGKDHSHPILLTSENIDNYVDKYVNLYSPMFCKSPESCYCKRCVGEFYNSFGTDKIGFLTMRIATKILNQALKAMHDSTVKAVKLNIEDYIE